MKSEQKSRKFSQTIDSSIHCISSVITSVILPASVMNGIMTTLNSVDVQLLYQVNIPFFFFFITQRKCANVFFFIW